MRKTVIAATAGVIWMSGMFAAYGDETYTQNFAVLDGIGAQAMTPADMDEVKGTGTLIALLAFHPPDPCNACSVVDPRVLITFALTEIPDAAFQ